MRLSCAGAPEVAALIAPVWPRMIDPHVVATPGPGVEPVEIIDSRHCKVITPVGVGFIPLRFGIGARLREGTTRKLTEQSWTRCAASIIEAGPAAPTAPAVPPEPAALTAPAALPT